MFHRDRTVDTQNALQQIINTRTTGESKVQTYRQVPYKIAWNVKVQRSIEILTQLSEQLTAIAPAFAFSNIRNGAPGAVGNEALGEANFAAPVVALNRTDELKERIGDGCQMQEQKATCCSILSRTFQSVDIAACLSHSSRERSPLLQHDGGVPYQCDQASSARVLHITDTPSEHLDGFKQRKWKGSGRLVSDTVVGFIGDDARAKCHQFMAIHLTSGDNQAVRDSVLYFKGDLLSRFDSGTQEYEFNLLLGHHYSVLLQDNARVRVDDIIQAVFAVTGVQLYWSDVKNDGLCAQDAAIVVLRAFFGENPVLRANGIAFASLLSALNAWRIWSSVIYSGHPTHV